MAVSPLKLALENLLRTRRLRPEDDPLEGIDRRLLPLTTRDASIDALVDGGFPRGETSQISGPISSGRTALALAVAAAVTGERRLAAWIDPLDRFDPASAAAAGVDLSRLFWLRGRPGELKRAVSAASVVLGSGLFELVVFDLIGASERERAALPGATWLRMQRLICGTPTTLIFIAEKPVNRSPGGVSLALQASHAVWDGPPGPGRLLMRLTGSLKREYRPSPGVAFERRADH